MESNKKKKILLLSDDIRVPSGVGTVARSIAYGLKDKYDIVQIGGAIKHEDYKPIVVDGIKIYPSKGYGNSHMLRNIMTIEQPDAMFIFTDPRYWIWLWNIEDEIRSMMPILYYHLWDDEPFPPNHYNKNYYNSNDWIGAISKLSYKMVNTVAPNFVKDSWKLSYIPHGIDKDMFRPLEKLTDDETEFIEKIVFKEKKENYKFIAFYNNRNVRRKMPGDVMLAFATFVRNLSEEKRDECVLLMHTSSIDNDGTDLAAVHKDLFPDINVIFYEQKIKPEYVNAFYNIADVTINLASNEGYGLATAESLMAGTPIIANITGGMQDQFGIEDFVSIEKWQTFVKDLNWRDKLNYGSWVYPLLPKTRSLVGSPLTPYIFDDRCDWQDAAEGLSFWYNISHDERRKRGLEGRKYLIDNGHVREEMLSRIEQGIENSLKHWKPRKRVVTKKI